MNDFSSFESVGRRYARRPGCKFVSAKEVGIAVFVMDLRVILIEPREVPPIDEFLLRAMSLLVGAPDELSNFLGLDRRTVENRLVELRRNELIELEPVGPDGGVHCRLTPKGRSATDLLHRAELTEVTLPHVIYHGFLRKPLVMRDEQLFKPREAQEAGLRAIPPIPGRPPRPEEIKLTELAEVIKQYWARRKKGNTPELVSVRPETAGHAGHGLQQKKGNTPELVSVRSVLKGVRTLYQKAVLLQYELVGRQKQQQFAFAIDGLIMEDYERAFTACDGPARFPDLIEAGYKSTAAVASEFMAPHIVRTLGPLAEVDELHEKIDVIEGKVAEKEAILEAEDRPDTRQILRAELKREKDETAKLKQQLSQRKSRRLDFPRKSGHRVNGYSGCSYAAGLTYPREEWSR